jgi:hypothetical protein
MKTIAIAVIATIAATSFSAVADARQGKKRKYVRHHGTAVVQHYSSATERQRHNTYAYDNGGYYERIQTAHVFGSKGWWELQNRGGGRR